MSQQQPETSAMDVTEATDTQSSDVSRTALTEQRDFSQGDILDMQRSGPLTLQGETNIAGTITRNENIYNDNRTINTNKTNVGSINIQANFSTALGDTTKKPIAAGGEGLQLRNRGRKNVGKRKNKAAKAPYNYKTAARNRGRPPPDIPHAPEQTTLSRLILVWMFKNKGKAALLVVLLVVTLSSNLVVLGLFFKSGTASKHDESRDISGSSSNTPGQVFRQPDRATAKDKMLSTISATYTSSFPLHAAIRRGDQDTVYDLIHSRESADIDQKDNAGNTPLHIAASMGSQRLVNTLIKKGAKVNAANVIGRYPIHEACRSGHLEVVQILCKEGADVNVVDRHGASPLTEAMLQHLDTIFDYLLDHGANIDAVDANSLLKSGKLLRGASSSFTGASSTPLNIAAQLNSEYYVAKLLKQGAKINVPDSRGWEPLHTAAFHNRSPNVLQLLKNNASVDALTKDMKATTALCLASQEGHLDVVVILLSHGAHVNHTQDDGASALFLAAQSGHTDVVDTLLKHGASINATLKGEESTPLCMAVQEGHALVVNKILDHDRMKLQSASSAMCLAAFSGHLSVVKALLDHGASVDAKNATANRTPLVYACQEGHLSVVRYLLDHGADINGNGGLPPLVVATQKNRSEIVRELAQRGADVNVELTSGSLLRIACVRGYAEVAAILIDHGGDSNVTYTNNPSYLMIAAGIGYADVVQVLIDKGADVNAQSADKGMTALKMAAFSGSVEITEVLLQNGARPDPTFSFSPLEVASRLGHYGVVEYLLSHSENPDDAVQNAFIGACSCARDHISTLLQLIEKVFRVTWRNAAKKENIELESHILEAYNAAFEETVSVFLRHGVDVNKKDGPKGLTALHVAVSGENLRIVQLLVERGADVNAKNKFGRTALDDAMKAGHTDIVDHLKNAEKVQQKQKSNTLSIP